MTIENGSGLDNEVGLDKKYWDLIANIMEEFEKSKKTDSVLSRLNFLERIYVEVIEKCPTFTNIQKDKYRYAINAIKDVINQLMFEPKKDKKRRDYLLVQKAQFIGILPNDYEIRRNIIDITTIEGAENNEGIY